MFWTVWSLDRMLILFVSVAFLLLGMQIAMFHYRQNFHHKSMWVPVISSPVFFVSGISLVWLNAPWLRTLFVVLMWLGVLSGAIGFYYHFRGVGVRVGGWAMRNFLIGPPVALPLIYSALCALGFVAIYWKV